MGNFQFLIMLTLVSIKAADEVSGRFHYIIGVGLHVKEFYLALHFAVILLIWLEKWPLGQEKEEGKKHLF